MLVEMRVRHFSPFLTKLHQVTFSVSIFNEKTVEMKRSCNFLPNVTKVAMFLYLCGPKKYQNVKASTCKSNIKVTHVMV